MLKIGFFAPLRMTGSNGYFAIVLTKKGWLVVIAVRKAAPLRHYSRNPRDAPATFGLRRNSC